MKTIPGIYALEEEARRLPYGSNISASASLVIEMVDYIKDLEDTLEDRKQKSLSLIKECREAEDKMYEANSLLSRATSIPVAHKGIIPFFIYDYDEDLKKDLMNHNAEMKK